MFLFPNTKERALDSPSSFNSTRLHNNKTKRLLGKMDKMGTNRKVNLVCNQRSKKNDASKRIQKGTSYMFAFAATVS